MLLYKILFFRCCFSWNDMLMKWLGCKRIWNGRGHAYSKGHSAFTRPQMSKVGQKKHETSRWTGTHPTHWCSGAYLPPNSIPNWVNQFISLNVIFCGIYECWSDVSERATVSTDCFGMSPKYSMDQLELHALLYYLVQHCRILKALVIILNI